MSEKIPGLPFELEWEGDPAGGASADGTIELAAPGATDMFFDPGGPTRLMNVPRLIGPAPAGDFQLSVKATVGLLATFDAGAIVLVATSVTGRSCCSSARSRARRRSSRS